MPFRSAVQCQRTHPTVLLDTPSRTARSHSPFRDCWQTWADLSGYQARTHPLGPRLSELAASPSPEAAFAALPLFSGVSPEAGAAFAGQGRLHRFRAGTVMFVQGDPPEAVYCILSGRVEVTTTAADGRVRLLAMVAAGDLLGELAVLGDMPRSGSAICVADTTAWAVDGQRFRRFVYQHPPVAWRCSSPSPGWSSPRTAWLMTCSFSISGVGWPNGCSAWPPSSRMPRRPTAP